MARLHDGESTEKENGSITTVATFTDAAGEDGENVLHADRQVAASDVERLKERRAK